MFIIKGQGYFYCICYFLNFCFIYILESEEFYKGFLYIIKNFLNEIIKILFIMNLKIRYFVFFRKDSYKVLYWNETIMYQL